MYLPGNNLVPRKWASQPGQLHSGSPADNWGAKGWLGLGPVNGFCWSDHGDPHVSPPKGLQTRDVQAVCLRRSGRVWGRVAITMYSQGRSSEIVDFPDARGCTYVSVLCAYLCAFAGVCTVCAQGRYVLWGRAPRGRNTWASPAHCDCRCPLGNSSGPAGNCWASGIHSCWRVCTCSCLRVLQPRAGVGWGPRNVGLRLPRQSCLCRFWGLAWMVRGQAQAPA